MNAEQEITQTLLSWTIFLLALHTDWQEKAREEALDLLGQRYQNYEYISKLKIVWELSTAPLFFHYINFFQKLIPKIL